MNIGDLVYLKSNSTRPQTPGVIVYIYRQKRNNPLYDILLNNHVYRYSDNRLELVSNVNKTQGR